MSITDTLLILSILESRRIKMRIGVKDEMH
jgi:hypothetical protein